MRTEIKFSPAFAAATVHLSGGEGIQGEGGSMLSMSGVEINTSVRGGLIKGLKRAIVGGESFFMNTFTAGPTGGQVTFAPDLPGDIVEWQLTGQPVLLQSGSFLACSGSVEVDTKWGGARTFFGGEGLICEFTGPGRVYLQSRSQQGFLNWLIPQLPLKSESA